MTHPDPFTDNTAMDKIMSEISKADEGGGPEMYVGENLIGTPMLSLRDYFAAHALKSLILLPSRDDTDIEEDADAAYEYADAMLEARKVKP